jgi:hypothetical protein
MARTNRKWTPAERQVMISAVMLNQSLKEANEVLVASGFKEAKDSNWRLTKSYVKKIGSGIIKVHDFVMNPTSFGKLS